MRCCVPSPRDTQQPLVTLRGLRWVDVSTTAASSDETVHRSRRTAWSLATKGGPHPLLQTTARYLQTGPYALAGTSPSMRDVRCRYQVRSLSLLVGVCTCRHLVTRHDMVPMSLLHADCTE